MDEYRNCESSYTTDEFDETIYGTAIVMIDDARMTLHYEDDSFHCSEEWRGDFKDGAYHLLKFENGYSTGGSAMLKRIGGRVLAGTWAADGYSGEWNIVLK